MIRVYGKLHFLQKTEMARVAANSSSCRRQFCVMRSLVAASHRTGLASNRCRLVQAQAGPPTAGATASGERVPCGSRPLCWLRWADPSIAFSIAGQRGKQQELEQQDKPFDAQWLARQSVIMAAASALLGPACDGQHSSHDVLHYAHPSILSAGPLHLETCWWVPILFGLAGVILGVGHPALDAWEALRPQTSGDASGSVSGTGASVSESDAAFGSQPRFGSDPPWPVVLLAVSLFVLQYAASGALEVPLLGQLLPGGVPVLDALLVATAVAHWRTFDATRQGLALACLTAVAGPVVEIGLIDGLHLYSYTHPAAALAVPTGIPWVYFCGAPAVGILGRKVSSSWGGARRQRRTP